MTSIYSNPKFLLPGATSKTVMLYGLLPWKQGLIHPLVTDIVARGNKQCSMDTSDEK